PDTSTRWLISLLSTASSRKSTLPVLEAFSGSSLPVGSLIIGRRAKANGFWWNSEARFHFRPIHRSPRLVPLHVVFISGLSGTTPPAWGIAGTNSGRMSRSMRFTSTQEAKISARSAMPYPKVSGQLETSVKPWLSSKLTRYALIDHRLRGSTSPVGTFQRPVSPMKVVVAGRVWRSLGRCHGRHSQRQRGGDRYAIQHTHICLQLTHVPGPRDLPARPERPLFDDRIRRNGGCVGRLYQPSAAAAADLPSLTAGIARFIRRPLMRGPLLVGGPSTLARDLTLLLR